MTALFYYMETKREFF